MVWFTQHHGFISYPHTPFTLPHPTAQHTSPPHITPPHHSTAHLTLYSILASDRRAGAMLVLSLMTNMPRVSPCLQRSPQASKLRRSTGCIMSENGWPMTSACDKQDHNTKRYITPTGLYTELKNCTACHIMTWHYMPMTWHDMTQHNDWRQHTSKTPEAPSTQLFQSRCHTHWCSCVVDVTWRLWHGWQLWPCKPDRRNIPNSDNLATKSGHFANPWCVLGTVVNRITAVSWMESSHGHRSTRITIPWHA